ncbi:threonine transporter RhtB [Veronia nyctiphanis]|uniref:Threonine transporter RhtB n=2 Tax=Veronia nyctiphanis TaxID=1278244 RepID=A0A4Q0YXU7_9GAMM|nr:LysE family translocator [Veronia nyctiphanis]RXJ73891.1 threonine transporter RhtB [Veronia nyctiphanis]
MAFTMDLTVIALFIPTFFLVSITPGMCMTLSLTLGMTIGVRRSMHMMWGELIGVGLVAIASVVGVAAVMLNYPMLFVVLKYAGGAYLIYLGIQMWQSKGQLAIPENPEELPEKSPTALASQGFITAIANPKGWAFMASLLPPFIDAAKPMAEQMGVLVSIILITEFLCLMLYASGGKTLGHLLQKSSNVKVINRIGGTTMMGVGAWLAKS